MPLQLADRVQVTATANTTVSFTLGSAVTGYQSFSVITNGNTVFYGASDGVNWETGIGTYSSSGPTLTRNTILSSSNSGSAVSTFGASVNVWIDYPSSQSVYQNGSPTFTTLQSTGNTLLNTSSGYTAIADTSTVGQFGVKLGTGFSAGGTWDSRAVLFGNINTATGAGSGALGLSFDTTAGASIMSIAPNLAWYNMQYLGNTHRFYGLGFEQFRISPTASAVNYVQITGGATGNNPTISAQGSDATRGLTIQSKGAADIAFANGSGQWGLYVTPVANTSNQLGIVSAVAGASPSIRSAGSDTNIDLTLTPKGLGQVKATNTSNSILNIVSSGAYAGLQISSATGNNAFIFGYINNTEVGRVTMNSSNQISFGTSSAATEQFRILHTASAVNYVSLYGSTTGNSGGPVIIPGGSDAAIPLTISTKSYGSLILNKNRDVTNTSQYLMNNVGGLTTDGSGGAFWRGFHQGGITYTVSGVNQFIRLASYHELNSLTDPTTKNWYITLGNTTSPTNLVLANNTGAPIDFRYSSAAGSDLSFRVATPLNTDRNYLQVAGAATTLEPILSAQGSDTDISIGIQTKGTGAIDLAAGSSGVNISNGGTVTAITRTALGTSYTSPPTVNISAPTTAGGVQATATVPLQQISPMTIVSGGTGYTVGDTLTVSGGTWSVTPTMTVATVSGGVITSITQVNYGVGTVIPSNPISVTGGTGTGATFSTTAWGIGATFTITNAGSGYIEQPTVTFSGGGGSGASAYATVGSDPILKSLTTNMRFLTSQGEAVRITGGGQTLTDYVELSGGVSGVTNGVYVKANGSSTNQSLYLMAKGTSNVGLYTNWSTAGALQFQASHTASAVNWVQVTGAATNGGPIISVQGSDANAELSYRTKGIYNHVFQNGSGNTNFIIDQTAGTSVVNRLQASGSLTTFTPKLASVGTDTNISLALLTKGTGAIDLAAGSSGVNISNGGTVTAVTRTAGGNADYTSFPTPVISAPTTAGGVQATATVLYMSAASATIQAGGTGYTLNDVVTLVGGTPQTVAATFTVSAVSGGVVTAVTPTNFQNYTALPTNPVSVTGGTGTGLTLNVKYNVGAGSVFSITNAGSGYIEQPTVTFSGGGGSGASAFASVGTAITIKGIGSSQERTIQFQGLNGLNILELDGTSANTTAETIRIQPTQYSRSNIIAVGGTNSQLWLSASGTGFVNFCTRGTSVVTQFRVADTASAVNYLQATGSATGTPSILSTTGSDASIGMELRTKGTPAGPGFRVTNNNGANVCFAIQTSVGTPANYIQAQPGATTFPAQLAAQGADTNIDLSLVPKGTGGVAINSAIKLGAGASAGTSGQVLTSAGAGASPTWSSVSGSGGMTLLGTITPTAVNSISLGSLTLTSYKSLYIVFNNLDSNGSSLFISATNTQTNNNAVKIAAGSPKGYGTAWLDLGTSAIGGAIGDGSNPYLINNQTGISTASTIIYFRLAGTSVWTAQGSIVIYGVV